LAAEHYIKVIQLDPARFQALQNLGAIRHYQGRYQEAAECHRACIALRPGDADARSNLGMALKGQGRLDEALIEFRQAMQINPADAIYHSNLLMALHYDPAITPEALFHEHLNWSRRHALALSAAAKPHDNARDHDRRL